MFEYKIVDDESGVVNILRLNELGGKGWELCGIKRGPYGAGGFYFKRRLQPVVKTDVCHKCELYSGDHNFCPNCGSDLRHRLT